MIHRERLDRPGYVYPADEWRMVEKQFYPRFLPATETIFSTANGYLGMRGTFEEGTPSYQSATLINGFYESWPIVYPEAAYGFATTGQTIVNATDTGIIKLYVDDEPFYLPTANLLHFERALDMRGGTLDRQLLWETPGGKRVSIKSRRLVSFQHRHLAAISYEVEVLNAEVPLVVSSEMIAEMKEAEREHRQDGRDPRQAQHLRGRILLPRVSYSKELRMVLGHETRSSKMRLACAVDHTIETRCPHSSETKLSDSSGKVVFSIGAQPGVPVRITKYMAYHTSRNAPPEELCERTERTLNRAVPCGFADLLAGQRQFMDDFWRASDVQIRGNVALQQAIRFNLFQICQATGRAEGAGVPAKGLTGQGYEGQYFWDAEIYVLPFLTYTSPRIARNLLKLRYSFLDKARARARELNHRGAMFPWRTINGEEASAYYAAGTAQYHINADIAYALKKYVEVTGDEDFVHAEGAEMLAETARLWEDIGFYSESKDGKFCIHGVTGPDEYNAVVDNNTYTNLMARENLWYAARTIDWLRTNKPQRFAELAHEIGLQVAEIAAWQRAADNMYIPFDAERGIHAQDDDFLDKERWDFDNTPPDKYPLLLHFHPLMIYRHQVIKQTDVVLAMFLLGNEFSDEQKKRNFDYYDPLTTGDSSLSSCIQSIVACEVGYLDRAAEYATYAALMDLADVAGNVKDGCHIASMGGTWMAIVYGFAGMRDYAGELSFRPKLGKRVEGLRFSLAIGGRTLEVDLDAGKGLATYLVREDKSLTIRHEGEEIELSAGTPVSRQLARNPP